MKLDWRNKTWWFKMWPYFLILAWTIAITIGTYWNTQTINTRTIQRSKAICLATNKLRAIDDTVINKLIQSDNPDTVRLGVDLKIELGPQILPKDCDDAKILQEIGASV